MTAFLRRLVAVSLLATSTTVGAAQLINQVVVVVNDAVITQQEWQSRLEQIQIRQPEAPVSDPDFQNQVLNTMVVEQVQLQRAQETGIQISEDKLDIAMENIARQNQLDLPNFAAHLEREGVTFAEFRAQVRKELTLAQLQQRDITGQITITPQDIERASHSPEFTDSVPVEYRLSHILLPLPKTPSSTEVQETRELAQEIQQAVQQGTPFGDLAIRYSKAHNAQQGGDMGFKTLTELPALISSAMQNLAVGEISTPLRSASGFHLVYLSDKRIQSSNVPERYRLRHLVRQKPIDHDLRADLKQIRDAVAAGRIDFEQAVHEFSEDRDTLSDSGDLGWVDSRQMPSALAQSLSSLGMNEVSEPVQMDDDTWHIFQLVDRESLEDVDTYLRRQIEDALFRRRFSERLDHWIQQLMSEAHIEWRQDTIGGFSSMINLG